MSQRCKLRLHQQRSQFFLGSDEPVDIKDEKKVINHDVHFDGANDGKNIGFQDFSKARKH